MVSEALPSDYIYTEEDSHGYLNESILQQSYQREHLFEQSKYKMA